MKRPKFLRRILPKGGHDEHGFTLAELIVAITIEAVIFSALAAAFLVVMNGGSSVNENLKRSGDARLAAAYIVSDARNSSGPEISLTDTTSCPDPTPPVAGTATPVARFNWDSPNLNGTTTANISTYVLVAGNLLRRHCEAGVLNDAILASNVASVTVACSANADCSGDPTSVTVTITETLDAQSTTPYVYSLTSAFRQLNGGGAPLPPVAPVFLLGGPCTSGTAGISISGSSTMKVYGDTYINTVDGASCHALEFDGSIPPGAAYQADSTSILTGGTCSIPNYYTCPVTTPYSPAFTDPYASLVPPTGGTAQAGCAGTAQPGVYAATLSIQGGSTCTLASGVYILHQGLSVGNGSTLKTAAGGVLIYIDGGAFVVNGGANVTITASRTGSWANMAVWQAATDTANVSFSNGGTIVLNGTLYAAGAQLNIVGGTIAPTITSVVVRTILLTGDSHLVVGNPPLTITPTTIPAWTINRPYSVALTSGGGDGSYTWSQSGLPAGLTFSTTTGAITGTPTSAATSSVSITLNDASGTTADVNVYSLVVNAAPVISTVSPLPAGEKTAPYLAALASTGGTAPLVWTATPASLPAGVTVSTAGVVSGTPTVTGTFTVAVTLTDTAGATATKSLTLVIAAQPTIVSVTLANGGATAGRVEKLDKITVVYSAAMNVSSFCSNAAWIASPTLSADGDVTVTLVDGGGAVNDSVTVASATCAFNFGTINLAASTYIAGGNGVFRGTSTNKSTIVWTASTKTLVITLGAMTGTGTVATVTTSTPIYTAGALTDAAGASLGNTPFTNPAGKKF